MGTNNLTLRSKEADLDSKEYCGLTLQSIRAFLSMLTKQTEVQKNGKIIFIENWLREIEGGEICYAHTDDSEGSTKKTSGAADYQQGIERRAEQEEIHTNAEIELFNTMSQEERTMLQSVDCFVYLGVGDGTKFIAYLKAIYNIQDDDELREIMQKRQPKLTVILKDVSSEFLKSAEKLLKKYEIQCESILGDMTKEPISIPRSYSRCYVSLGNTICNFDIQSIIQQLQQTRNYYTTYWYISSTLPEENETMQVGYKDEQRIENWFINSLKVVFGPHHEQYAQYFELSTDAHQSIESDDTTLPIANPRVLIGLKIKDEYADECKDGLHIPDRTINSKNTKDDFIFYPGGSYFFFQSNRFSEEVLYLISQEGGAYDGREKSFFYNKRTKWGKKSYHIPINKITTHKNKVSAFREMKPSEHVMNDFNFSIGKELRFIFNNPGVLSMLLILILGCIYLKNIADQQENKQQKYALQVLRTKIDLLKDIFLEIDPTNQISTDSLYKNTQYIEQYITTLMYNEYKIESKEDKKAVDHILQNFRGWINTSPQANTIIAGLFHTDGENEMNQKVLEKSILLLIQHFNEVYVPFIEGANVLDKNRDELI